MAWLLLAGCQTYAATLQFEPASGSPQPAASTTALLQQMEAQSGRIFLGTVTSIRLAGAAENAAVPEWPDGSRVVEITIAVEECVAGCKAGSVVMREWASMWRGRPHRYVVGQRAVWILYPENAAGVTSPVRGMLGVLPVRIATTSTAGSKVAKQNVDLRWVQSQVLRAMPNQSTAAGAAVHPQSSVITTRSESTTTTVTAISSMEPMNQPMAPLSVVMGVLHANASANATQR